MAGELDKLTGLLLEKSFQERLDEEMQRDRRYKASVSIVMIELDFSYYEKEIDLKKLIKKISKPIVTISQPLQSGS